MATDPPRTCSKSDAVQCDSSGPDKIEWTPELIPIWQDFADARWLVSTASDRDPDNARSGWLDVDANAQLHLVEVAGVELTPAEARNLAEALRLAADHAESFGLRVYGTLTELTGAGRWPELDSLPIEIQAAVRGALRQRAERFRRMSDPPADPEVVSDVR